jgi:hypothetical protein
MVSTSFRSMRLPTRRNDFYFVLKRLGSPPLQRMREGGGREGSYSSSLGIFAIEYLALGIELNQ